MQKFLTHEAIAAGVFNEGTCCATSSQSEWADVLTVNRQNLTWLIQRMSSDFNSQHTKMRKPWSSKELVPSSHHLIFSFPFSCLVGFSSAFEIHIQRNCPFATTEWGTFAASLLRLCCFLCGFQIQIPERLCEDRDACYQQRVAH